ncbi:MAG: DUF7455 domain-containing protein [Cetobacterium sp.]
MDTILEETPTTLLTAEDRCDQCGAPAVHIAIYPASELMFCNHHFVASEDLIRATAREVLN